MEEPISKKPYWLTGQMDKKGQPVRTYTQPAGNQGIGLFGHNVGGSPARPPDGIEEVYANGEVWDVAADGSEPMYLYTDPQLASKYRSAAKSPPLTTGPDKNKYRLNPKTGQYELAPGMPTAGSWVKDEYGNIIEIPPGLEQGQEGPLQNPRVVYQDPGADIRKQQDEADLAYKQEQLAKLRAGPQLPLRYADEALRSQLQNQKLQQELQDPVTLMLQQHHQAIDTIRQQMVDGQIQPEEANRLIVLSRQALDAALQGTTPFQQEQERLKRAKEQQDLARNILADQLGYGSSMATSLLSGLGGIYGKILGSEKPPALDPLQMAKGFTQQMQGGPQLGDMARNLLMGAMSQGKVGGP